MLFFKNFFEEQKTMHKYTEHGSKKNERIHKLYENTTEISLDVQ